MATWVKCKQYNTVGKEPIWINLDHVISIRGFENGSVLQCVGDIEGRALELVVWERPEVILSA